MKLPEPEQVEMEDLKELTTFAIACEAGLFCMMVGCIFFFNDFVGAASGYGFCGGGNCGDAD